MLWSDMEKTTTTNAERRTLQFSPRWLPSLTWMMVMAMVSVVHWSTPVDSHGSHSGQPRQRRSGQVRDPTADSSAYKQRTGNQQEPSAGFHDSKIVHDTELVCDI